MSRATDLREAVTAQLLAVINDAANRFAPIHPAAAEFFTPAATLLQGGKRMRAILADAGYQCVQPGGKLPEEIIALGVALELFQGAALVHDDIIDDSDARRSNPSTHVYFASRCPAVGGENATFGRNAAILLGDLLVVLAEQHAAATFAPLSNRSEISAMWAQMTQEVAVGQYLDVYQSFTPLSTAPDQLEMALRVVRHKSGRYSVEHPLALGAALGGGDAKLIAVLRDFGGALGEAFQLRDDDLGVFGDPHATGKPAGDDLREGKRTALIALTLQRCTEAQCRQLQTMIGDRSLSDADVHEVQTIVERCGARAAHEALIAKRRERAFDALARLDDASGAKMLRELALELTDRRA